MAFEQYVQLNRGRGYATDNPKVSIWAKSGLANFNKAAAKMCSIETYEYLVLFFDEDTNRVGFRFTNNQEEEGRRKLNKTNQRNTCSIQGFLRHYNIDHSENRRYDLTFDEKNDLYVIQL